MELTVARAFAHYVVVSDHAIIRIERRSVEERRQAATLALVVGGVVGPLLAAAAERLGMPGGPTQLYLRPHDPPPLVQMTDVTTWWASEVPAELAELAGWPRVDGFRPVTFYPRGAIAALRLSRWQGLLLTLRREAARDVVVPIPAWHHPKIRRHLLKAGYPLAP